MRIDARAVFKELMLVDLFEPVKEKGGPRSRGWSQPEKVLYEGLRPSFPPSVVPRLTSNRLWPTWKLSYEIPTAYKSSGYTKKKCVSARPCDIQSMIHS